MPINRMCISICILGSCIVSPAFAQDPAPATAAAAPAPQAGAPAAQTPTAAPAAQGTDATPAAPAPPVWSAGPIDFSGMVDGYYGYNFNHPASQTNQLYNFNDKANQFSLTMAMVSLSHTADPVGFQVDIGFGRAFEIFNRQSSEKASDTFRFLKQAYLIVKPAKAKGFELDFGKFVTSAGAEIIETNGNWNYSRSLLFAWAIPYYHFGVRTSIPIGKYFTGGVQVVNGWNNVGDNNSGKTVGLTGVVTTKKLAWSTNYYVGPENDKNVLNPKGQGLRQLFDTTILFTPPGKMNAYINFDYGRNVNFPATTPAASVWYGIAGALHCQATGKIAFTPRLEWFKDRDGFSTGLSQDLKEFTITGEYKMLEGLLARLEYRRDWSNQRFFDRGNTPGVFLHQNTLTLGVLAFFGPKR